MLLTFILALPFACSLCAALLPASARRTGAWLAGLCALACLGMVLALTPDILAYDVVKIRIPWIPTQGVDITLRIDGYAWLFAVIITAMGALIALYAHYYLSEQDPVPRFFAFLLSFMGAMLGVVLSGNLIQLLVFWELTSLSSFMLIGYWHHRMRNGPGRCRRSPPRAGGAATSGRSAAGSRPRAGPRRGSGAGP